MDTQSTATEGTAEQGTKDQGLDTPDSKKKKKKKTNTITDIVPVEEPIEKSPIQTKEKTPEKGQSSRKQSTEIIGKDSISHTWFNDFSTQGKWLDGYASYPVGFCSNISPEFDYKIEGY